jgi:hypothetical protein
MQPHEQEGKTLRKIRPYPSVVLDDIEPVDQDVQDMGEKMLGAVLGLLGVIVIVLASLLIYIMDAIL